MMGAGKLAEGRESLRCSSSLAGHTASLSQPGFVIVYLSPVSIILEKIKTFFFKEDGPKIC